jgi:hypothetical protein
MLQHLVVALIVLGASLYAGWTLLPAALRRPLARKLLPLAPNAAWLRKAAGSGRWLRRWRRLLRLQQQRSGPAQAGDAAPHAAP